MSRILAGAFGKNEFIIHTCSRHRISLNLLAKGDQDIYIVRHNLIDRSWIPRYINSLFNAVMTMITVGIISTNSAEE